MRETKTTQQPSTYSVAYPGAATTYIDTFVEHITIECTEHENPCLSYLETTHQVFSDNCLSKTLQSFGFKPDLSLSLV